MFGSSQVSPLQSIFLALVLLIAGLMFVAMLRSPQKRYLSGLFFSAFILRTAYVYVVYYYLVGVGGDGFVFSDDRNYDAAGTKIAAALSAGKDGYALQSWQQNPGYFYLNGWLYSILGTDTFSARVINAFLSSLTAVLVFEISRTLFNLNVAKIAGLLAAFMPSIVFLSVLQFKDTALVFVMVFTVYLLVVKKNQNLTVSSVVGVILALFVMWFLRKDYTLPYIGIVLLWLLLRYTGLEPWLERMQKRGFSVFAGAVLMIMGAGLLIGLSNIQAGKVFIDRYDKITSNNKDFTEKAKTSQIGFSRNLRINSPSELYKLPFSVAFTAILPLPAFGFISNGEKAGLAIYSISNLFFIMLIPYLVVGFALTNGMDFANSIMIKWFPFVVLIAISVVFMGVLRYKEQLMPFFVIWAANGIYQRQKYKTHIYLFYFVGFISVFSAVVLANMSR